MRLYRRCGFETTIQRRIRRSGVRKNKDVWLSHPSWFIIPGRTKDGAGEGGGTLQGRITCKKGAHQTDPDEIQALYKSRWVGGRLVWMDLSQIELRVAALLSGDEGLLRAYQNGEDLHGRRALAIWGQAKIVERYPELARVVEVDLWRKECKGFSKREGQVGKRVNFADLFRSGAETMQKSVLGDIGELMPLDFFQGIVRRRAADRPGLWAWQERVIDEAARTGKVELPFTGQSRAFLGGEKYEVNEIVNFPVQTTAGNTLLRIQAGVSKEIWRDEGIKLYLNVYDALKFDCRGEGDVGRLKEIIARVVRWVEKEEYWSWLQERYGREVPLGYEVKEG